MAETEIAQTCANCKFWKKLRFYFEGEGYSGECAPPLDLPEDMYADRAITGPNFWCTEYQPLPMKSDRA